MQSHHRAGNLRNRSRCRACSQRATPSGRLYFADELGGDPAAAAFAPGPALILIGPEGGFTDEERSAIRGAEGASPITLGPRILRAETAALAAITAWMIALGEWERPPRE